MRKLVSAAILHIINIMTCNFFTIWFIQYVDKSWEWPTMSHVALSRVFVLVCFRTDGRTPCVKIMTTYWPGPGGSKNRSNVINYFIYQKNHFDLNGYAQASSEVSWVYMKYLGKKRILPCSALFFFYVAWLNQFNCWVVWGKHQGKNWHANIKTSALKCRTSV